MDRAHDVLRRLGDPTRLRVLAVLLSGRRNVSQIVADLGLSQPQVSYHLRMLREAGLASEEREGRWVWYAANWESGEPHVREILSLLAGWSEGAARAARPARPERRSGRGPGVMRSRGARPGRKALRIERPAAGPETDSPPESATPPSPPHPGGDLDDFLL